MALDTLESDKKFLLKSGIYNLISTVLKVAAPVLAILTARIFGKEEFGIFVSIQLWMLTLSRIAVLGLDKGLLWFLPQNSVHNRPLHFGYGEAIGHTFVIAVGITLILLLCANFELYRYADTFTGISKTEVCIYALSLAPWVLLHIFGGISEGMKKPQYKMFITDCSVTAVSPLLAICFYFADLQYALPAGLLCANIFGCFLYLPLIKKLFNEAPKFFDKIPKELLRYSLPIGLTEILTSVLLRIDLWMVLLLLGPAESGVYAVMVMISNGLRTVRLSFAPILLPVIAGMNSERLKTDLKSAFSYCVGMVTAIQLVIGLFLVLFPDKILMIAGKDFVVQPATLGILLFVNLLAGFFNMSATVLNGMGKSFYTMKVDIIALFVAVSANYLLIPRFGLVGAALSTFIFTFLQALLNNIYIFKLGMQPYSKKLFLHGMGALALISLYFYLL